MRIAYAYGLVSAYALLFWIVQWVYNWGEAPDVTALYSYWDYTYFNIIQRLIPFGFLDSILWESSTRGPLPYPLAGILPYGILNFIFGSTGFVFGDLLAHALRLTAFIFLVTPLFNDPVHGKRDRYLAALVLFFATSEFVLGDFRRFTIFHGIWGDRLPRPAMTSTFLLLALGVLIRMGSKGLPQVSRKWVPLSALPVALLCGGDIYAFISVALTYVLIVGIWISNGSLTLKQITLFGVCALILCLPFIALMQSLPAEYMARIGKYEYFDLLATLEIPTRYHLMLLFASFIGWSLLKRKSTQHSQASNYALNLITVSLVLAGVSTVASLVNATVTGTGIQEYQFADRRDQFYGLMVCIWPVVLIAVTLKTSRTRLIPLCIGLTLTASWVFYKRALFAQKTAQARSEPNPVKSDPNDKWRDSANQVVRFLQEQTQQGQVVVATLDPILQILTTMNTKVYLFNPPPFQTTLPFQELTLRYYIVNELLGVEPAVLEPLLRERDTHVNYLTYGTFQFNRITTWARHDLYPPEALAKLREYRDNWYLFVPPVVHEALINEYRNFREAWKLKKGPWNNWRGPDFIVVRTGTPHFSGSPQGFVLTLDTPDFRVYKRGSGGA